MLLLAVDTSGKYGSIALAKCGPGDECNVVEVVPLEGGTFSAQLVPQIAGLLAKHSLVKGDLGGFAIASGPGSFTGLRVGLAAIKGLAEILDKPVAVVSLLEAIAMSTPGQTVAALDAGRGEAYLGDYDGDKLTSERIVKQAELVQSVEAQRLVTPDKTLADIARSAGLSVEEIERPTTAAIAQLGWRKIRAGNIVSVAGLEANYIRRSDAEIFSKNS